MEMTLGKVELCGRLNDIMQESLRANKMKAVFHFDFMSGKLVFDKVLGRDSDNCFYNDESGNLEKRKEALKLVIVSELLNFLKI